MVDGGATQFQDGLVGGAMVNWRKCALVNKWLTVAAPLLGDAGEFNHAGVGLNKNPHHPIRCVYLNIGVYPNVHTEIILAIVSH